MDWWVWAFISGSWLGLGGLFYLVHYNGTLLANHDHIHDHQHSHGEFAAFAGIGHQHAPMDLSGFADKNHEHPPVDLSEYEKVGHVHSLGEVMVGHVHSWVLDGIQPGHDEVVMLRYSCDATPPCGMKMLLESPPDYSQR